MQGRTDRRRDRCVVRTDAAFDVSSTFEDLPSIDARSGLDDGGAFRRTVVDFMRPFFGYRWL